MVEERTIDTHVGVSLVADLLKRIDIENYRIFSEFIDNSLQSYKEHIEVLKNQLHIFKCKIDISWTKDEAVIKDNAFGMVYEDFERAVKLDGKKKEYVKGSLSRYGIGLKYAAINMGNYYVIETSSYGSNEKYIANIDVNKLRAGDEDFCKIWVDDNEDVNSHYTTIIVKNLCREYCKNYLSYTKECLSRIYYHFLNNEKILQIKINGSEVKYEDPELLKDPETLSTAYENIQNHAFSFNGKVYEFSGWMSILSTNDTSNHGLVLIQNNRGIDINFKPKQVFGLPGDQRQQRIVGEVVLTGDSWEVRIDKDDIVWEGNGLKERFIDELASLPEVKLIMKQAKGYRKTNINVEEIKCSVNLSKKKCNVGDDVSFSVTPNNGYKIDKVLIDNCSINSDPGTQNRFTFRVTQEMGVTKNVNLKAVCVLDQNQEIVPTPPIAPPIDPTPPIAPPIDPPLLRRLTEKEKIEKSFSYLKSKVFPGSVVQENPVIDNGDIVIEYSNTKFSFEIEKIKDRTKDFFEMKLKPSTPEFNYNQAYKIIVNTGSGLLGEVFLDENATMTLVNLSLSMAIARLLSAPEGLALPESKKLINNFNSLIKRS